MHVFSCFAASVSIGSFRKSAIKCQGFVPNHVISRPKSHEINTLEPENPCKQFTTIAKLFNGMSKKTYGTNNKISIIGLDDITIATAFTLLSQNITDNLCLIDMDEEVLKGELLDLQLGSLYHNNGHIVCSKDPAATIGSKICIVVTGTYKSKDEHPSVYVGRNISIMKVLIPPIVKYNPDSILIIASDPVDALSYASWKLSGFPKNRVIGTGTLLDTARFRYLLSMKTGISPKECHGYIIGQHGECSLPVWSNVNIAGVPIKDINPKVGSDSDGENWQKLHSEVVKFDDVIRRLKGYSAWSSALAIANLCKAICTNSNTVMPVSTYVKGEHTIVDEVFLSLPCVIGEAGVSDIIRLTLSPSELDLLRKSADNVSEMLQPATKMLS